MAKQFVIVGTKPARVHHHATVARVEVVGLRPRLRVRDEDQGMIVTFASPEAMREFAEVMLAVADHMEKHDAKSAAKLAADLFDKIKGKGAQ